MCYYTPIVAVENNNDNVTSSDYIAKTETPPPAKVEGVFCSCVKGVRLHVPELPRGDARDFIPNTTPHIGAVALFKYSDGVDHMAYIDYIGPKGFHVIHYNKEKCQKTDEWVAYDDPALRGFYEVKQKGE